MVIDLIVLQSSALIDMSATYKTATTSHVSMVQKATMALSDQGTREDTPTGSTPKKRTWRYVDEWELTESRQALLGAWRSHGMSAVGSETFLAEHLPLPVDDGGLAADPMNMDAEAPILSRSQSPVLSETEVPMVDSLQSSTSSTSTSLPIRPTHIRQQSIPTLKKTSGKAVAQPQPQVPLADTRNVYTTRRGTRRR